MRSRHVVIVGAGVLGLSAAVEMTLQPGLEVTVLDRAHPGAGSTGLSAGVFTSQYLSDLDIELRAYSMRRLAALERDHGLNLRRIGFARLARDAETIAAYEASAERQARHGIPDARVIDAAELAALVPGFDAGGVLGALYSPHDGYLDGSELAAVLADEAVAQGARLAARTRLLGMRPGGSSRYELVTDRGTLPADVVVNAAGAWGQAVGELLDAPIEVVNERHEAYVFELPDDVGARLPMVIDYVPGEAEAEGLYFRHEGEGQLVAGLHSNAILGAPHPDPDDVYAGVTQSQVDVVVETLDRAFPGLEGIRYRGGWAGLYPHSPDQRPIAGPHPSNPDVLVGAGLGGIGLSLGPVLGRVLAEWVRDGEPSTISRWAELLPAGARASSDA